MPQYWIAVGAVVFVLLLGARAAVVNPVVRRKLRLSLFLVAGFTLIALIPPSAWDLRLANQAEIERQLESVAYLLLALAIINAAVTLIVNPLRSERVPDRFPNIVQDALVIGVFLIVGSVFMQEKWLALSAVGGFVIGFALQDTLGNMFAGLAVQVEKPFHVGQWISVAGHEGMVTEITWRATRLRTGAGTAVVIPNNILSKEAIINFSEPGPMMRQVVDVGVSYDAPPNDVKHVLLGALADLDLVVKTPEPEVVVADFGASAILYRLKFWVADYASGDRARDHVRTAVYYALRRRGMDIPYPIQVEYKREVKEPTPDDRLRQFETATTAVDLLSPLDASERIELLASAKDALYGAGEVIVRQGQPGDSMFIVCRGEVRVTIEPGGQEVARIGAGGYFGEMSLLTGDPRSATVVAACDSEVLEITADQFRTLALSNPAVVEQVSLVVADRRVGLQRTRDASVAVVEVPEAQRSFLSRVQQFLGLSAGRT